MILFINACVRKQSRTLELSRYLLKRLDGDIREVRLVDVTFPVADEAFIIRREELKNAGHYDDPMFDLARDFAKADMIVIAAPLWDLSFPAALKQYFEQINVLGLTFRYSEDGTPSGLCQAKSLFYVTTAGGTVLSDDYGYGYVRAMSETFYGIQDIHLIKAEGLDIIGADTEKIMKSACEEIESLL